MRREKLLYAVCTVAVCVYETCLVARLFLFNARRAVSVSMWRCARASWCVTRGVGRGGEQGGKAASGDEDSPRWPARRHKHAFPAPYLYRRVLCGVWRLLRRFRFMCCVPLRCASGRAWHGSTAYACTWVRACTRASVPTDDLGCGAPAHRAHCFNYKNYTKRRVAHTHTCIDCRFP